MSKTDFLWNELIYGGHWGSISASAIVLTTMVVLQIAIRWDFLLLAYLVTQCTYNYNRIKEIDIDSKTNSARVNHLKKYKGFLCFIPGLYGCIFFLLLIIFGDKNSILFGGIILILGLLFTIKAKNLSRIIPGFKSVYTGFAWGLMVIFTSIYCSYNINISVILFS
ncbi:MAG: hypothetical protein QXX20_07685, partial [Candidatus Thermoplasmatota archaeon]